MPLNLIGLLQASRAGAAPGQGFKNYAAGAPTTGTAMSHYIVGDPLTSQSISGVAQLVGTLTPVSSTFTPGTPVPAFTNVTVVASFQAGVKAESIYDAGFVAGDTQSQVLVGPVRTDGLALDTAFQYANIRSVSVDWATKRVTAVVTFNNSFSFSGASVPPFGPANSGYVYVPFRLSFRPEPYFNLRSYSGEPNNTGGFSEVVVRPYRTGQPTPAIFSGVFVPVPTDTGDWIGDGSLISATKGDFYYMNTSPGNTGTNYYLSGYVFRPQLNGGWTSGFNTDYASHNPQVRLRWYRQAADASWPSVPDVEQILTSVSANPATPQFLVTWSYPDGENPSVNTITVRLEAQVISPFTSPVGYYDYTFALPQKSSTLVGPGGGPVQ